MATYPTLPTKSGSDPRPVTGPDIDRAEDGTARARNYGADKVEIQLTHPFMTAAQKTTLSAFYTANRLIKFDYVSLSDGVTYSCLFAEQITWQRDSAGRHTASIKLAEA